jgi:hypothetical protein
MDFAMRTLFVIDLWLAMSIITSIILESTLLRGFNGVISLCIFVGSIFVNLIVLALIFNTRKKSKMPKFKQDK